MSNSIPRIMIAGTGSGCGKTSVTCALLAALKRLKKDVVAFKCGPDYIDPLFHRQAIHIDSYNLDTYLMGEEGVRESLVTHSAGRDIAIIEGVMGLYDGIGQGSRASSNHLARITGTPTVLVVNPQGKGLSVCAEIQGFLTLEENSIVAVILNQTKPALFSYYQGMIENRTGLKVLGFLPYLPPAIVESRHLGLITADEIPDIQKKIAALEEQALQSIDIAALQELALISKNHVSYGVMRPVVQEKSIVRLYVACDEAFCFHYEDNHRILRASGAELHFFSPIRDATLPNDADGLIFWGGYPELHAVALSSNGSLRRQIRAQYEQGLPIYAECGGFMYLQEYLTDQRGEKHPMLGIVAGGSLMTDRLQQFGYVELESHHDNMLCDKGDKIKAHSFHYATSTNEGNDFTATKANGSQSFSCIVASQQLFAGYPHLHFGGNWKLAGKFINACLRYKNIKCLS